MECGIMKNLARYTVFSRHSDPKAIRSQMCIINAASTHPSWTALVLNTAGTIHTACVSQQARLVNAA